MVKKGGHKAGKCRKTVYFDKILYKVPVGQLRADKLLLLLFYFYKHKNQHPCL